MDSRPGFIVIRELTSSQSWFRVFVVWQGWRKPVQRHITRWGMAWSRGSLEHYWTCWGLLKRVRKWTGSPMPQPLCFDQILHFDVYKITLDHRREDTNTTKSGPSSASQRNTIEDDVPTLNAGLVALWFFRGSRPVLLRNHKALWFFRGAGGPDPRPLLWILAWTCMIYCYMGHPLSVKE